MDPSDPIAMRRAIAQYLATHPHAADSADGVARWWLAEAGGAPAAVDAVRSVLDALVAEGVVRRATLADGTVLYAKGR